VQGRETELFVPVSPSPLPETPATIFNVPSKFVELAKTAILHRDAERELVEVTLEAGADAGSEFLLFSPSEQIAVVQQDLIKAEIEAVAYIVAPKNKSAAIKTLMRRMKINAAGAEEG
jgi:hypothetical protein